MDDDPNIGLTGRIGTLEHIMTLVIRALPAEARAEVMAEIGKLAVASDSEMVHERARRQVAEELLRKVR
nr:hypothetical protein [uncultured Lichenicoccus sp.]